ncbi:hypothetical protein AKO1_014989 [Acrasis kona]|uniref:Uncharacterized protein n=1 Tax=Acrasis kona TaxID=1008807 RepID=A0AAW2Z371_9EUKA
MELFYIQEETLEDLTIIGLSRERQAIELLVQLQDKTRQGLNQEYSFLPVEISLGNTACQIPKESSLSPVQFEEDFLSAHDIVEDDKDLEIIDYNEPWVKPSNNKKRKRELVFKGGFKRHRNIDPRPEDRFSFKLEFK